MPRLQALRRIILPQAMRVIVPLSALQARLERHFARGAGRPVQSC